MKACSIKIIIMILGLVMITGCTLPESMCIKHKDFEMIQNGSLQIDGGTFDVKFRSCAFPQEDEFKISISDLNSTPQEVVEEIKTKVIDTSAR